MDLADPVDLVHRHHATVNDVLLTAVGGALVAVFRLLARLGALTWFVDHQRSITTFATNLRGPGESMTFMGARVCEIVAIASTVGNTTVAFAAMSCCRTLAVTLTADLDRCPELPRIAAVLRGELETMTGAGCARPAR